MKNRKYTKCVSHTQGSWTSRQCLGRLRDSANTGDPVSYRIEFWGFPTQLLSKAHAPKTLAKWMEWIESQSIWPTFSLSCLALSYCFVETLYIWWYEAMIFDAMCCACVAFLLTVCIRRFVGMPLTIFRTEMCRSRWPRKSFATLKLKRCHSVALWACLHLDVFHLEFSCVI